MDFDKFKAGISKTGFELEYRVGKFLRSKGWNVINGKYYIDDLQDTVREIDLVAYKVKKVQEVLVYTTLIVSCKKSDQNAWVLLGQSRDLKDPNMDWLPLQAWSNHNVLSFTLARSDWRKEYIAGARKRGCEKLVSSPDIHIFAFQEMNKVNGKPQNDTNIFASITSLMKAQAYEIEALPDRKKDAAVYQFNLLSVIDADLVRMEYVDDDISAYSVQDESYVASYIVNRKQTFSRIHFFTVEGFEVAASKYSSLHLHNVKFFESMVDAFYADAVQDAGKRDLLMGEFFKKIRAALNMRVYRETNSFMNNKDGYMWWNEKEGILEVNLIESERLVSFLNDKDDVRRDVSDILKKLYRYEGEWIFGVDDIPF